MCCTHYHSVLLWSCIQRSMLFKTLGHVRVFLPLSKQVSDPLMAVGFGEGEDSASKIRFLMDENLFSLLLYSCH